jgi:hypothetical protein
MKIISGGQTGVDRAALDVAIERGMDWGGWCPKGGWAEDLPDPPGVLAKYPHLKETPDRHPLQRTEWNVRDSDGTVVFSIEAALKGGTKETIELATKYGKPVLHVSRSREPATPEVELLRFIKDNQIQTLNVAGPRASDEPDVAAFVQEVLEKAWATS